MAEVSTKERYKIIYDLIEKNDCKLNLSWLCKYAGVSRSGYYDWIKNKDSGKREINDKRDFELILEAYKHRGYAKGSRSIQMRLMHKGINIGRHKIRRLMQKYNLVCSIRKPNPYKQMAKAIENSAVAENIVKRQFKDYGPRKILLTDITYLFYGKGQKAYLSSIKDAYTNEILAWVLSPNLMEDFVLQTINMLFELHGNELECDALIHSDQGIHYKCILFRDLLKEKNLRQSMSRKANCWDNSPQESFHGHMKDEINLNDCNTFDEVKALIDDYIDYYNNERYQWNLAKLSPAQFYKYSITGIYPL